MRHRMMILPVLLVVLLICMTGSASAEKRWVSIDGTTVPAGPKVTVINSNETETILRFDIPGFWVEEITEEGQTFHVLRFPGYGTTLEIGKPELPVISKLVAIPARAGVTAHVIEQSEVVFEDFQIRPFQKILNIGEKRTKFDLDHEFYKRNELYPKSVEVGKPGIWRDLRVANLRVAPIRCNPANGKLSVCNSMTVKFTYSNSSEINVKDRKAEFVNSRHDAIYSRSVLNYDELGIPVLAVPSSGYDLLIISQDDYIDNLDPLVTWKQQRGYKINVVPLSSVGTTAIDIKNYIQSEYDNHQISYCLLVGDGPSEGAIPFYYIDGGYRDFPYSLLEGSDNYPEIGVGRFPVANETEVDNMVAKTISYESDPPDGDWLSKSLLIAHLEHAPGGSQAACEIIRQASLTESSFYYSYYPIEFVTAYGADPVNGGDGASNQDVIDNIHSGVRVVTYCGHGDYTMWYAWNIYNESFGSIHVDQCDNGEMTPVVFSLACLTAKPVTKSAGFGAYFTRHEEGAVAFFGSTVVTSGVSFEFGEQSHVGLFDRGIPTISDATNEAIVQVILKYGSYGIEISDDYLWYGDPTLSVTSYGDGPQAPELVSPEWGDAFDSPIQVTLDWSDVGKTNGGMIASCYQVQLDDDPDFSSPIADVNFIYSEWTTPELNQGIYYWRVRTFVAPDYGPWSEASHFFVGMDVAACELISPEDGAKINANTRIISFRWQNIYDPGEYLLQLDDDPEFGSPKEYVVTSMSSSISTVMLLRYDVWYWRVKATNPGWPWSEVRSFRFQISNKPDPDPQLTANFPNPFNPSTTISFELPKTGHVKLEIFNVNGALITTLADEIREAGRHDVLWNGKDAKGVSVASGIYFYRLKAGSEVVTKKMMLLR